MESELSHCINNGHFQIVLSKSQDVYLKAVSVSKLVELITVTPYASCKRAVSVREDY